eukprot:41570_1
MASRNQHQNGMSHLKSCIEASNTLKSATDETVNSCFTQIVNEIFGGKRNLLQSLLSPQSNLKEQQRRQIKQIFHTKCQEIIDFKSDTDANNTDPESCIQTLINIAEPTQVIITSFLDFRSINRLKNVCSSITPICIDQLLNKMDIKTLNVHKLIGNRSQTTIGDVIESSLQTHRVHRAHTLKSFIQKETTIAFDNLLCFKRLNTMRLSTRLFKINDMTLMRNVKLNARALLFMDKSLVPQPLNCSQLDRLTPMAFVQEFDIKHQSLRITDIVHPNNNLMSNDIKQMIKNRIHEEVTLYIVSIRGQVQRIVGNCYYSQYNEAVAIIYQRNSHANMSESTKEEFKVFNYKQLK